MQNIYIKDPRSEAIHLMDGRKYQILRASLLNCLSTSGLTTFNELLVSVSVDLKKHKMIVWGQLAWNLQWVAVHLETLHQLSRIECGVLDHYQLPLPRIEK